MKLINHLPDANFNITGHGKDFVMVNKERLEKSLVISPTRLERAWVNTLNELNEEHIAQLVAWQPAVLLLGTGHTLTFPKTAILRPLIEAQIGFEVMDTQAACRTYNVLVSEDRFVVAALIV
ncbi:Mth938-like domain-containing protein [Ferrovum sp. PN-J185]|uniref:Mth938-like domain-containing protein n=1 Tax=Ferrovum sp. PN-J185 TaxID=1356306 RepID=UPI00079CB51D|nr:Mth938-like domain-containing protein [Ferrovum sp. PN-J185]KXW56699.1 hypothetical protein FV185_06580 [Ferrovum sp. PN-J185]MCC6067615.1 Mth938-like domain-containing protein [Ferrovum sp. PN-J185]